MLNEYKKIESRGNRLREYFTKWMLIIFCLTMAYLTFISFLKYKVNEVDKTRTYIFGALFIWLLYYNLRWNLVLKYRTIKYLIYDSETSEVTIYCINDECVKTQLQDVKYLRDKMAETYEIKVNRKTYYGVGFLSGYVELRRLFHENCKEVDI